MIRALAIAVLILAGVVVWQRGTVIKAKADRSTAKDQRDVALSALASERRARDTEQKAALIIDTIGNTHEEARQEAESIPAAVAADLRAGNVRLRSEWAGCETQRLSDASASARERDALAASRDQLAGEIVRIGRDADDQLRACQAVVNADRKIAVLQP